MSAWSESLGVIKEQMTAGFGRAIEIAGSSSPALAGAAIRPASAAPPAHVPARGATFDLRRLVRRAG